MKLFSSSKVTPILATALLGTAFAGTSKEVVAPPPAPAGFEAGWTLGLEALALRPFQGNGLYRDSDFDFGGRVSLGYQFEDGLFTRLTYFGYGTDGDADLGLVGDILPTFGIVDPQYDLEVSYWDLVIGDTFRPTEKLTIAASVGLRQARFDESLSAGFIEVEQDIPRGNLATNKFEGLGIVVGLDVKRKLTDTLSFYITGKQSIVFGKSDIRISDNVGLPIELIDDQDNTVVSITELGGGLQYDFAFSGVDANIRAGVEGQYWADPSINVLGKESAGLGGFVLGANFRF